MSQFAPHRRHFLLQSMLLGLTLRNGWSASGPIRQGIHQLDGPLLVDGQSADSKTPIRPGQSVATGPEGRLVLVFGQDAFLLGAKTSVDFHAASTPAAITGFTVNSGKILSVFGKGPKLLKLPTTTIGIRGTGIFLQVEPQRDYMCLCYGEVELRMKDTP
ncbi:MAG: hypothetical protein HQL93_09495, partial [Magnetococcales bacterium]|nr:hypothetical protein [Magnetococcales bacterium]